VATDTWNYLKDEQYYIDRYDLHTIEECLDYYWSVKDSFLKARNQDPFKKYSEEKFKGEVDKCLNRMLFTLKGERYRHKKKTVQEWIDRDRQMQDKYDNTPAPGNTHCKVCSSPATVIHKDLHNSYESTARMMFMFECTKCKKRYSLFENGTEWKYEAPKCPKCKHPLKTDLKIKGDITAFTSTCSKCGYKEKDVSDHKKWKREQDAKEKKDKELLKKYRLEFCLSDKEGEEYIETTEAMAVAAVIREEEAQKFDSPIYQRSLQLKKTTIADLEKLLAKNLEKAKFIKLSFDKPEIGQYVIVPFTVQDSDSSRKDRISSSELEKLIKNALEDTNWRLLSNSIHYRLGYLEGQLKGFESEEDMLKLAGKKEEAQPKSKIDDEKRQKYASNNLVQLAKLLGEHDGIENMRKRRLEQEPEGFFLEASEDPYTCGICHNSTSGEKTWWDLHGIRCSDCQRNLKEGIVPLEIFEDDYGYDVVISNWDFRDGYGVHPSSVKKLRREGLLKGRDLKSADGTVYYTIYLVSENQEFLKKYPKKESIKVEFMSADDGKKIQL